MKVLVTGASGFIGRPLTAALAEAGYQVRAAVRDPRGQSFSPGIEVAIQPDLASPVFWSPLLSGMDAVVHTHADSLREEFRARGLLRNRGSE